jgi:large subunit ribosomal protein L9
MAKSLKLLLTESVDNLGIVGDVVTVRTGYARNYLLPRQLATTPSEEMVKALAAKRAEAERQLAELRQAREETVKKLEGFELTIERSCNDLGILYAAVTQQEIAKLLGDKGYGVRPRDVRIPNAIKRIDTYEVHIKFDADLEAAIKLWIVPDRKLDLEKKEEMEFDSEGNLIERPAGAPAEAAPAADRGHKPARPGKADKAAPKGERPAKGEKHGRHDKHEKADKAAASKAPKAEKPEKADKKPAKSKA